MLLCAILLKRLSVISFTDNLSHDESMSSLNSSVEVMTFRLLVVVPPPPVFLGGEVTVSMFPLRLYSVVSYFLYFVQFVLITIYCRQKLLREGLKDPLLLDVYGKERRSRQDTSSLGRSQGFP